MNIFKRMLQFWKKIQIFLLYIISILLVFWIFPREGKFQYEYVKNSPWKHADLIAPFDFPIYKNDDKLAKETDSIAKTNPPYFKIDTTVIKSVLGELSEDLGNKVLLQGNSSDLMAEISDTLPGLLGEVYLAGIIESHPVIQQGNRNAEEIFIVRRQLAEKSALADVFTEKMAYEHVVESLKSVTGRSNNQLLTEITISKYIQPNLFYDALMTQKILDAKLAEVSATQGMVQSGQIIIRRGELVSQSKYRLVESLRKEYESNANVIRNDSLIYLGQFVLIAVMFLALLWYVSNFRKDMMGSSAQTIFILSLIVIMVGLTKVSVSTDTISYYVIPFAIIPIFLKTFFNVRFALFVHFMILLLAGFLIPNNYQFLLMNFLAGVVAVFSMQSYYRRSILFFIASFVAISYALIYVILSLLQEGTLESVEWIQLLWFGGNGLLILTVYPLIYIFERLFGFLSDSTLFELSDTNQPLLRKLAEKAPGTFQHSIQVANLAEEAILKIGGNPLLVRTGALYHDIGKMNNPYFFIENQRNGENPHDDIDYKTSAKIIIDHVMEGVELAKRHNLPQQIIDFILTHHGTSTVQYFYRSYLSNNPDEDVDQDEFRYPGPRPTKKEMAVLMVADSVEAAARSMKDISDESLSKLVENIVEHQTEEDQYAEAEITFSDISIIKEIFKQKLINIYHARISYPE
ncbi:MAG: HDIG domain-containing protein [Bacteroidales bacterium]|nr:HDIG domain-containing protein [Bacteroidales bacterium]